MELKKFDETKFAESKTFKDVGDKYSMGQVTIIGGSKLFHGAPILALKAASRMVSMTYFSSPIEDKGVAEKIKAGLSSFIWVDRNELDSYVAKSDAILIGPGLMRSHSKEQGFACDTEGNETRKMSVELFEKYPDKNWVIDGGTLQVVEVTDIPKGAVVTPNGKEFEMMFGEKLKEDIEERCKQIYNFAKKYELVILTKDTISIASDGKETWSIEGGNSGLVKGGIGDIIAGLTVGLMAKNERLFSVSAATLLIKKAAERLAETRGFMFNADDLVEIVPEIYGSLMKKL
ncbi:MAG TPA: ADP/ATP-dependent (S)-NAD(P)H-hydrate dehydratase [Spirochaetia bacterium]|nr:ADP/ATP-dependent (S)-NAD(P)H-hydrate dehydratase [Spirochaetia bacterium]